MNVPHYTPRVGARAELAAMIKARYLQDAKAAGLTEGDLDVLVKEGEAARLADREQHEEMATIAVERSARAASSQDCFEREQQLRARLLAVIEDLRTSSPEQSAWLSRISFARYRLRELAPAPDAPALPPTEEAEVKRLERIERADIPTRLDGIAAFCAALTKPGREIILEAFATRALDAAWIAKLGADADALARSGKNSLLAADATARESAAVLAQRTKWASVQRMIRNVAQKHPDLARLLSAC
jgi:hypothetical protein